MRGFKRTHLTEIDRGLIELVFFKLHLLGKGESVDEEEEEEEEDDDDDDDDTSYLLMKISGASSILAEPLVTELQMTCRTKVSNVEIELNFI